MGADAISVKEDGDKIRAGGSRARAAQCALYLRKDAGFSLTLLLTQTVRSVVNQALLGYSTWILLTLTVQHDESFIPTLWQHRLTPTSNEFR